MDTVIGIINKINKLSTFKKFLNRFYPRIIQQVGNIEIKQSPDLYITPEHPLFIEVLKKVGYTKDEIEVILVDYYSGESLENILKNTGFVLVAATVSFIFVYGSYFLAPILATIKTEKQLFDYYNDILQFISGNSSSDEE